MADDEEGNWEKGDVNVSSHRESSVTNLTRQAILPCFVAVEDNLESLDLPGVGTAQELAAAYRKLEPPPCYPREQESRYKNRPGRFPAAVEVGNLGALSDALIGKREWDSPAVLTEKLIALGEPRQAESFFRSWRRHAVEQVVKGLSVGKNSRESSLPRQFILPLDSGAPE